MRSWLSSGGSKSLPRELKLISRCGFVNGDSKVCIKPLVPLCRWWLMALPFLFSLLPKGNLWRELPGVQRRKGSAVQRQWELQCKYLGIPWVPVVWGHCQVTEWGHLSLQGDGSRSGDGHCVCNSGYKGELCDECMDGHYEELKNDTHTICARECHP